MSNKLFLILVFCIILGATLITLISAAVIEDDLHLNIQVTYPNGTIIPSTPFDFAFNITTDSGCSNVIYSNLTTLTTDTRGIVKIGI